MLRLDFLGFFFPFNQYFTFSSMPTQQMKAGEKEERAHNRKSTFSLSSLLSLFRGCWTIDSQLLFSLPLLPPSFRSSGFGLGHADHVRHLEAAKEGVGGEGTHPELPVVGLEALQRLDDAFHLRHAGEGGREGGGKGGEEGRKEGREKRMP